MTTEKQRSGVVDLRTRRNYRPDVVSLVCDRVAKARECAGLSIPEFAAALEEFLGWLPTPALIETWESTVDPPGKVVIACEIITSRAAKAGHGFNQIVLAECEAEADQPRLLAAPLSASENAGPGPGNAAIQDGDDFILPCRASDGRIIWVSIPRRTFLSGGLSAAALATIATVGPSPSGITATRLPTTVAGEMNPVDTLRQLKRALIDADNLLGPTGVLPAVHSQIQVIRQLRADRRGADGQTLLALQAQYAEFAGWLHQDAHDFRAAGFWLDRALEWSYAAADKEMATYVMARKSQLAGDMCDSTGVIDLANAASSMARKGSRLKATAATYGAHGYALSGERKACLNAIDGAREMASHINDDPESPWATWLDGAYIDVQRGRCLAALGEYAKAATEFQQAIRDLPPAFRRDRGVYLAREALAHTGAREPEQAAHAGMQAIAIAHDTQSGRIINELARVGTNLAPWANLPRVAEFQDALTSVLPTERTG